MKKIILIATIFLSANSYAQNLPPVFDKNTVHDFSSIQTAYLSPTRIVWSEDCGEGLITNIDNLLKQGHGQTRFSPEVTKLRSTYNKRPAILLDFGKQIHGGLQLNVAGISGIKTANVRIRFGESVSEAMSDITPESGATNDHAMRDFVITLPGMGFAEIGNSGFRFVRIDIVDPNVEVNFQEIRAMLRYRDIPYKGSFVSSDKLLNDIWLTGAYTVHLNMQEYLWDGIKRDRLVWIGDMHPEVMTINNVFGYNEVVPKSLDLTKNDTPIPNFMNGISSYSIWWILIQRDWYYNHGDFAYLKEQQEYLTSLLRLFISQIGEDGKENLQGWRFMDWPTSENPDAIGAGLQSLMVMAMNSGEELANILGDKALAKECADASAKLQKHTPDHGGSKQAAALMSLAGLMDAKKINDEVVAVDGAKNFSTFYGYYMLRSMAKAGDYIGALDAIRSYWGGMLSLGATTFWEDFDLDWLPAAGIDELVPEGKKDIHADYGKYCYKGLRHSLCHGWSSGPTAWLSEYVLGIQVIEPGCKVIRISPNLGDLEWAEGTFPTPYGVITIRHDKDKNGKITSSINAPKGVKIIK